MLLRGYRQEDCARLITLFQHTVRAVNAKDYTPEQLDAWASGVEDTASWNKSLLESFTVVAEVEGAIVGFGNITSTGYLAHLFVDALHQREGIAKAICDLLESAARSDIVARVSLTAFPFFQGRGYRIMERLEVRRKNILLPCLLMMKERSADASASLARQRAGIHRTRRTSIDHRN